MKNFRKSILTAILLFAMSYPLLAIPQGETAFQTGNDSGHPAWGQAYGNVYWLGPWDKDTQYYWNSGVMVPLVTYDGKLWIANWLLTKGRAPSSPGSHWILFPSNGGSSTAGISSINGDSTSAQIIQGAGGITVGTVAGTTTISGGGSSSAGVTSLNGEYGIISLGAGPHVSVVPKGKTIAIDLSPMTISDIAANTAKIGITSAQANDIIANNAKVIITTEQASAIVTNTAKAGITLDQSSAIIANTAKVGISSTQVSDIAANTAKVGITKTQVAAIIANASAIVTNNAKIGITTDQSNAITNNTASFANYTKTPALNSLISINTDVAANTKKIGISQSQVSAIVANTAKKEITTSQASAIVTNTAKVGITTDQATEIKANTIGITNIADGYTPLTGIKMGTHTIITSISDDKSSNLDTALATTKMVQTAIGSQTAGVSSVDGVSGAVSLVGAGSLTITKSGQDITFNVPAAGAGMWKKSTTVNGIIPTDSLPIDTNFGLIDNDATVSVMLTNAGDGALKIGTSILGGINSNNALFGNYTKTSALAALVAANSAVALNTIKVGITTTQKSDIVANSAKVGITPTQTSAIKNNTTAITNLGDGNTNFSGFNLGTHATFINASDVGTADSKTDIASCAMVQAAISTNHAIMVNTTKVGILPAQATAITTNTTNIAKIVPEWTTTTVGTIDTVSSIKAIPLNVTNGLVFTGATKTVMLSDADNEYFKNANVNSILEGVNTNNAGVGINDSGIKNIISGATVMTPKIGTVVVTGVSDLITTPSSAVLASTKCVADAVSGVTAGVTSINNRTGKILVHGTGGTTVSVSGLELTVNSDVALWKDSTSLTNAIIPSASQAIGVNTGFIDVNTVTAIMLSDSTAKKLSIGDSLLGGINGNNTLFGSYTKTSALAALVAANSAVALNTAKTGITGTQTTAITTNTSGVATNVAGLVSANKVFDDYTKTSALTAAITGNSAVTANTVKKGITTTQSNDIVANIAKVGISSTQVSDIVANNSKVGITKTQVAAIIANASAIVTNTAKVGITSAQAMGITDNTKGISNIISGETPLTGIAMGTHAVITSISDDKSSNLTTALATTKMVQSAIGSQTAGVSSVDGVSGAISLLGTGTLKISKSGQDITFNVPAAGAGMWKKSTTVNGIIPTDSLPIDTNFGLIDNNATSVVMLTSAGDGALKIGTSILGGINSNNALFGNYTKTSALPALISANSAVALNTAKTGITGTQTTAIATNTSGIAKITPAWKTVTLNSNTTVTPITASTIDVTDGFNFTGLPDVIKLADPACLSLPTGYLSLLDGLEKNYTTGTTNTTNITGMKSGSLPFTGFKLGTHAGVNQISDDITSHASTTLATTIMVQNTIKASVMLAGYPVPAPTSANNGQSLVLDWTTKTWKWVTPSSAGAAANSFGSIMVNGTNIIKSKKPGDTLVLSSVAPVMLNANSSKQSVIISYKASTK